MEMSVNVIDDFAGLDVNAMSNSVEPECASLMSQATIGREIAPTSSIAGLHLNDPMGAVPIVINVING
jgi:hypothetical protein